MTREIIDGIVVLTPDEGKWLSNGETNSKRVYIGSACRESEWHEVDEPVYDEEIGDSEALDILLGGDGV